MTFGSETHEPSQEATEDAARELYRWTYTSRGGAPPIKFEDLNENERNTYISQVTASARPISAESFETGYKAGLRDGTEGITVPASLVPAVIRWAELQKSCGTSWEPEDAAFLKQLRDSEDAQG